MTGKSSLLALFADEKFNESYIPTIGIDFRKITKYFGSQFVKVIIW